MKDRGFTLIEMMVALVVVGLVVAGTSAGLRAGVAAWRGQARVLDAASELDAADRALRGLIERMDPGTQAAPATLAGEPARMRFSTALPDGEAASAVLGLDDRRRLVLRWQPRAGDAAQEAVLLDRVEGVSFAYAAEGGADWAPAWRGGALPALVRVHVAFRPGDPRVLPDIVAAPMRARG